MSWLDEKLCDSGWHDEGHASHSTCPSCGGKGMRKYVEELNRKRRENFERSAREWAVAKGWMPPKARLSAANEITLTEQEAALVRMFVAQPCENPDCTDPPCIAKREVLALLASRRKVRQGVTHGRHCPCNESCVTAEDAEFIAAFDPPTVLALIEIAKAAERYASQLDDQGHADTDELNAALARFHEQP